MSKFEEKKKLLAAESEVYRQLLKLEFQTFKVYGMRTKRRLTSVRTYLPLVMSGIPFVSGLFGRKGRAFRRRGGLSFKQLGSLLFMGWKAYRKVLPLWSRGGLSMSESESRETAAEEYLSKRL